MSGKYTLLEKANYHAHKGHFTDIFHKLLYTRADPLLCCSSTPSSVILSTVIACHAEASFSNLPPLRTTPLPPATQIGSKTTCHF